MDLLRVLTKRVPSPLAWEGLPPEAVSPQDRLVQLNQDIFFEEERHQCAMMAMDSSVLGCGSDDWSVDSDYAFQEFGEDALRQSEHSQSTASPERAHRNAGVPTSSMEMPSGMVCTSEDQTQEEVVRAQTQAADGAQMPSDLEERQSLEHEELRESKEDATAAKSDEQPICLSEARLFGDPGSSTDSTHILKLEQRMFLKAAFQLLEERDRLFPAFVGSGTSGWVGAGGRSGGDLHEKERLVRGSSVSGVDGKAGDKGPFHKHELHRLILRSGTLRKATARSVGRLEKKTWKTKFIEVSPGRFAYADGPSVLGKSRSAKVIPLYQGFCTCRVVRRREIPTLNRKGISLVKHNSGGARARGGEIDGGEVGALEEGGGGHGSGGKRHRHLLEIDVVGSKRRVWAAESKQECRQWVSAIKGAMTERPVDPTETAIQENKLPAIPRDCCHRFHMKSYLAARSCLRTASTIEGYLSALGRLREAVREGRIITSESEETPLGVPVKWVKQQLPGAERMYQVSARHRGKSALAQLWKDMKRDTVSINGKVLKGDKGPEAIVGALTRCILAQAGRLPPSEPLSKLSEAQSLLAARDVLLACDRTTSGGDTYLVVDNLCRNPDLVVLVPASQEAEPLDIQVTLHLCEQVTTSSSSRADIKYDRSSATPPPSEPQTPPSPSSPVAHSAFAINSAVGPENAVLEPTKGESDPVVTTTSRDTVASAFVSGRLRTPVVGSGPGSTPQLQQSTSEGGVGDGRGPKRRGRMALSTRRPMLNRSGSASGGRMARPALTVDPRSFSSLEGWQRNSPKTGGRPSVSREASPSSGERDRWGKPTGGVGIFTSLGRRRSGDTPNGKRSRGGSSTSTPRTFPAALSARDTSASRYGGGGGGGAEERHNISSAPAQTTSRAFFGEDTDDGGQNSGSSYEDDEEDELASRRSHIQVACTARTSYKLFSCDPQDEDRDVYAFITGLFEQTFTICRELTPGGRRTSSGMGSATRTEGSVAFLTFHEPLVKRGSIDRSSARAVAAVSLHASPKRAESGEGFQNTDRDRQDQAGLAATHEVRDTSRRDRDESACRDKRVEADAPDFIQARTPPDRGRVEGEAATISRPGEEEAVDICLQGHGVVEKDDTTVMGAGSSNDGEDLDGGERATHSPAAALAPKLVAPTPFTLSKAVTPSETAGAEILGSLHVRRGSRADHARHESRPNQREEEDVDSTFGLDLLEILSDEEHEG